MQEAGLRTLVVLGLFLHDERHPTLHDPLAGRPGLLIHHLAHHLAREAVSIERLRLFHPLPLTEQSAAHEFLQRV